MTKKQLTYRNFLLNAIHSHPFYDLLQEWEWEKFLNKNYGVSSSKLLGNSELKNLLLLIEGKVKNSLIDKQARREVVKYLNHIETNSQDKITLKQIDMINKIKSKLDLNNRDFWRFVASKIGYFPIRLNLISKLEANRVVSGLLQKEKNRF